MGGELRQSRGVAGRAGAIAGATIGGLALAVGLAGAIARVERGPAARRSAAALAAALPTLSRATYVGSGTCAPCHPAEHASWAGTFHRTMTQVATPTTALAPFAGEALEGPDGTYRATRRGEELWVTMVDPEWKLRQAEAGAPLTAGPTVERRVVMTTGSHHMQVYWVPTADRRQLLAFPFTWLVPEGRWVPNESTLLRPPEGDAVYTWDEVCIQCHAVAGAPRAAGGRPAAAELGIACEACHGPGAAHVAARRDPLGRAALRGAEGGDPTIVNPARLDHRRASEVCGLCHSAAIFADEARWRREGVSFRPGGALEPEHTLVRHPLKAAVPELDAILAEDPGFIEGRLWPDGSVKVAGRELSGLVESGCYQRGELSCLSCHQLHGAEPNDQLAAEATGDGVCVGCHPAIGAAIAAHTRHPAESAGSRCYGCHMPRTTYGLLGAIRSHTIDSPEVGSGSLGRPNACNLCHLDQTLGWTAEHLERWFGAPQAALDAEESEVAAGALWALRGDASQRALVAWHMGAAEVHAAAGRGWLTPFLVVLLEDPYDAVRAIAGRSLARLPEGSGLAYDYVGPAAARSEAAAAAMAVWAARGGGALEDASRRRRLLLDASGALDLDRVAAIRARRDDRPIDLRE